MLPITRTKMFGAGLRKTGTGSQYINFLLTLRNSMPRNGCGTIHVSPEPIIVTLLQKKNCWKRSLVSLKESRKIQTKSRDTCTPFYNLYVRLIMRGYISTIHWSTFQIWRRYYMARRVMWLLAGSRNKAPNWKMETSKTSSPLWNSWNREALRFGKK